ncbi:MAG: hypothetical protein M3N57_08840 [Actinomycetota bacterium]|nr:hypothetical protein [Actinomycetota bacterium]
MRIDELRWVCEEAARDLVSRADRPLPAAVVLPGPSATRVVRLPDLPDSDADRTAALRAVARDEVLATSTPAYGFVAEAELADGTDVVVVIYGAHGARPEVTAAPFEDAGLGDFVDAEPLDPHALPFLRPLQEAVEQVREPPAPPGIPGFGG